MTIARGHLELLGVERPHAPELGVALDELDRIERIVERLLLLAKADQPDFVVPERRSTSSPSSRTSSCAGRRSRRAPGGSARSRTGTLHADPEALRDALDALLENAVKYTELHAAIELSSRARAER